MKTVYLYGGMAKFAGTGHFEWNCPVIGSTHKFILFISQNINELQESKALDELTKFGFSEVNLGIGKPISVDALNEPRMQAFQKHYDGALAEGCSIVWYP